VSNNFIFAPSLRIRRVVPLLPLHAFLACKSKKNYFSYFEEVGNVSVTFRQKGLDALTLQLEYLVLDHVHRLIFRKCKHISVQIWRRGLFLSLSEHVGRFTLNWAQIRNVSIQ
jgi:hypothetical protein